MATWLIQSTGDLTAPAWYLCAAAMVTITVTLIGARSTPSPWGRPDDRAE